MAMEGGGAIASVTGHCTERPRNLGPPVATVEMAAMAMGRRRRPRLRA